MGIFTTRCSNPACDHRVWRGSQFCAKCGTPVGSKKEVCPACGTDVRHSANFCFRCGIDLRGGEEVKLLGDRWARERDDFVVRIDSPDLARLAGKSIVIEHGTRALFFKDGRLQGELPAGRHELDAFVSRWGDPSSAKTVTIVLAEAGDVTIDLENDGVLTSDPFRVATRLRLVLRLREPEKLFVNLLKDRKRLPLEALECELAEEAQMVIAQAIAGCSAKELHANLGLRASLESVLREQLSVTLDRYGLELVQLRFLSIEGEALERLRRLGEESAVAETEAEIEERRAELNHRLREVLTQDRMDRIRTENEFETFVRDIEHQLGLKGVIQNEEMTRLKEAFQANRDRENLIRAIEQTVMQNEARRREERQEAVHKWDLRDEERRRELAFELEREKVQAEKGRIQHALEKEELDYAMGILERVRQAKLEKRRQEQEIEAKRLEARSRATAEALLSITEGPAADKIAEIEKLRLQQNMSPEQILALAAQASPAAAQALAKKYEAEGQIGGQAMAKIEEQIERERRLSADHADRLERVMQSALAQMGAVATTRARPPEPVPNVIAVSRVPSPQGQAPRHGTAATVCRECQAPLEEAGAFCPRCGAKQ